MTTWSLPRLLLIIVHCVFASFLWFSSCIIYVTVLSHYHELPTFTATAFEYMLLGLLREHQNNYPLVLLPRLECVPWSDIWDHKTFNSRANRPLISVFFSGRLGQRTVQWPQPCVSEACA